MLQTATFTAHQLTQRHWEDGRLLLLTCTCIGMFVLIADVTAELQDRKVADCAMYSLCTACGSKTSQSAARKFTFIAIDRRISNCDASCAPVLLICMLLVNALLLCCRP
jgi:hypothetical protein